MASSRREGLRIRLKACPAAKQTKSNKERCKEYRESIKADPARYTEYRLQYLDRNQKNRHRQLTEEEILQRREQNKQRQQKYRDRQKAQRAAQAIEIQQSNKEPTSTRTTRFQQNVEETAVAARRMKWTEQKRKERQNWSAQKRRRNREKALAWYHQNKRKSTADAVSSQECQASPVAREVPAEQLPSPPDFVPSQTPGSAGARKAMCRAKKAVMKVQSGLFGKLFSSLFRMAKTSPHKRKAVDELLAGSPSAKKIKQRCFEELDRLKSKRSRQSLLARKLLLDTVRGDTSAKAPGSYRKKKSAAALAIQEYLEDVSIDLPGKKSVNKKTMTQKKILPKRLKRHHKDFCDRYSQHKVSRATFYRHIPKHILPATKQVHRQCLCEVCVGVDKKLDVLNKYLENPVDGRDCLSDDSMCKPPTLLCYNRTCDDCGVSLVREKIDSDLSAESLTTVVKWNSWDMVQRGKTKRRDLVDKEGTLESLVKLLLQELEKFSMHLLVFRWQYTQYKTCKAAISQRPGLGLAVLDFAENFLCKFQDEVQSAYYGYSQVTVHPSVTYYQCQNPDCSDIVTEYLVFLSDDLNHDACLAKTIMDKTIQHMMERVNGLQDVAVFSDGCAAQYKSKLPLFHLANASRPVALSRAYFGSRHGKSPCDACGGVIKRAVDEDVMAREVIVQNAHSMYRHCTAHYSIPANEPPQGECCHTRRLFFLVEPEEVDRAVTSSSIHTIPGTRLIHSVRGMGNNIIQTRKLSCFCPACLDGDETNCHNTEFVSNWETIKIKLAESHINDCNPNSPSATQHEQPEMPTEIVPPPRLTRNVFFRHLYRELNSCQTYKELEEVVASTDLSIYPLPPTVQRNFVNVKGTIDECARNLKPATAPPDLYPLSVSAEGNCLPCCLSVIAYGTERHHIEMRCRVVHELVTNRARYTTGVGMGENSDWVVQMLVVLQEGSGTTPETMRPEDVDGAFQRETAEVRQRGVSMGLWQLAAGANILHSPIVSVYPEKGWKTYQTLYNRTLSPLISSDSAAPWHIMWSSNRDEEMEEANWVGNHFVCLLPISTAAINVSSFRVYDFFTASEVSTDDFFVITWNGDDYICRVDQICGQNIVINMMQQDKDLFVWPVKPDTSLEHVGVLKERVSLELVPECSNQRKQCYRLV